MKRKSIIAVALVIGIVLGAALSSGFRTELFRISTAHAQQPAAELDSELAALRVEVERLKNVVPDQAHAMSDVSDHFANLWFAGKAENWPLAEFYWKETVSHMKWAVRIIPVRKDNAGKEVKLEEILASIENAQHLKMGDVVANHQAEKFEPMYRSLLEACYSCHKASDKSYLRLRIPEQPASSIVNFDPNAAWPR